MTVFWPRSADAIEQMKEEVESQVVNDFKQWLNANDKGQAVAVGAIHALTNLIKASDAQTIMELEIVLKNAQEQLQKVFHEILILFVWNGLII